MRITSFLFFILIAIVYCLNSDDGRVCELVQNESVNDLIQTDISSSSLLSHNSQIVECTENMAKFLAHTEVVGFHLLCFHVPPTSNNLIDLTVWKNGTNSSVLHLKSQPNMIDIRETLEIALDLNYVGDSPPSKYDWEMFPNVLHTKEPLKPIKSFEEFLDVMEKGIFIFQGGRFIWPGVKVGHKQPIFTNNMESGVPEMYLETLSLRPLIFNLGNVLSFEDCDELIEIAKSKLESSQKIIKEKKNSPAPKRQFRTSSQANIRDFDFFKLPQSPIMKLRNISTQFSKIITNYQESTQIIHYSKSQFYQSHYDFFSPAVFKDPEIQKEFGLEGGKGNRIATILYYLSDVEEGGETNFPHVGGFKSDYTNPYNCSVGLKVTPKKGSAILFYNMLPNGQFDWTTVHGGCPVLEGEKWAVNKWIWTNNRD